MKKYARGTNILSDDLISNVAATSFDAIILPGGMPGARKLSENTTLINMLRQQKESNKLYGAICASPAVVLAHHGLLFERGKSRLYVLVSSSK